MSKITKKLHKEHSSLEAEYSILTADELFLILANLEINRKDFFEQVGLSRSTVYRYARQKKTIPRKYHPALIRFLGGEEQYKERLDTLRTPIIFWLVAVRKPGRKEFVPFNTLFTNEFEARVNAEHCAKEEGSTVICTSLAASVFAG